MAAALVAANGWLRKPSSPTQPLLEAAPVTLAPGIHLLGRLSPAAAYVVETSAGLVLIDSGVEPGGGSIARQFAELKLDPGRLRTILLTHAHADHSLGARYFRQTTGAKIYAGREDAPILRAGGPREAFCSIFPMPGVKPHPTEVDVELSGGESIDIGDAHFEAMAAPGHTPGSICYWLEQKGLRMLFAGDVVISLTDNTGPLCGLGTYTASLPPRFRGDAKAFLKTLQKLQALPAPDLVLPGHPELDPAPVDPRLPPARWQALLQKGIDDLQTLIAHFEADGANFLDGNPQKLLPDLYYLGDFGGAAVYALATPAHLFVFDAPAGEGFVPWLGSRLREAGWGARPLTAVLLTSCGPEATAGLSQLVEKTACQIVCSSAGTAAIRRVCPAGTRILNEKDFVEQGWFPGKGLTLSGRGVAPLAFQFPWHGKSILVSGRIPVRLVGTNADALLRTLSRPGSDRAAYLESIQRLGALQPDLWLPALPWEGQNANLYGHDWADVIALNARLVEDPDISGRPAPR
jgi:glyoxylase-like metal-dependent hydrolase (beta-lactamase superfamily II)